MLAVDDMGFLSHRVERSDLKEGYHIYTWRKTFAYTHHGIYVGDNRVVHFTQDCSSGFPSSSSSTSSHFTSSGSSTGFSSSSSSSSSNQTQCLGLLDCGFRKEGSGVVISCLNCFLGNGSLRRFDYGVGTATFISKFRGGTCTMAESNPPGTVVYRAMYLLYKGFGNYNKFTNNCEDFALYCKTGILVCTKKGEPLGGSGQATSVVGFPLALFIVAPLRLIVSSSVGILTAAAIIYSFNRYAADIGVGDGLDQVEVEKMEEMFQKDTSSGKAS